MVYTMAVSLYLRKTIRFIISVVVFVSNMSIATHSYRPFPKTKPPEIWLDAYQGADNFKNTLAELEFRSLDKFENQFISKFNKTNYVITEDTNLVYFTCQAKYPVKWSFPHMKHVENLQVYLFETSTSRKSNFNRAENSEPTNESYQTVLTIRFDFLPDIFSANLTCGVANSKGRLNAYQSLSDHVSSIYVFYAGKHVIENQGSTIQIQTSISKKIVLPCRPATPTVSMLLEKLIDYPSNPKTKWKPLKYSTQYLNFDPKVGFVLEKDITKEINVFGLYKCTALDDGDDINEDNTKRQFVYVNVTSNDNLKIDPEVIQFKSTLNLKGDATIAYNNETFGRQNNLSTKPYFGLTEFLCCSGVKNTGPSIYSDSCVGYLQCEILKWSMTKKLWANTSMEPDTYLENQKDHSDCSKTIFLYGPVIFCRGQNVQFSDHFVNVFKEGLIPVSERSHWSSNETLHLSIFELESRNFDVSRKMFLTIGYPITSKQLEEVDERQYQLTEFLQLDSFDGNNDMEYDYIDTRLLEDLTQKKIRIGKIAEYPRDHFYVGETLVPICLGWTYLYSYGAYVGINFQNGTKQIVNLKEESVVTEVYFSGGLQANNFYYEEKQFVHKFGWQVSATKDMVSVECWMPQWDTKNWDRIIRNVTILDAVPPSFERNSDVGEEEIVYFYLGDDEGEELVWTVNGGAPKARIYVTKDGRKILKKFEGPQGNFQDYKRRDSFESLFNVTLETDNGTKVEVGDGTTAVVTVRIRFNKRISHEMQGVYQCNLQNIGGSIRRSYLVIVEEKRNAMKYILLVTTILCSFLLIGLGLMHWRQRKQVVSLRHYWT